MIITIQPFEIGAYDEVLVLWQKSEGVGLSGADSRENIRSYLERNPGLSFVAFLKTGSSVRFWPVMTAVGAISTIWLSIRTGGGRGSAEGWWNGVFKP